MTFTGVNSFLNKTSFKCLSSFCMHCCMHHVVWCGYYFFLYGGLEFTITIRFIKRHSRLEVSPEKNCHILTGDHHASHATSPSEITWPGSVSWTTDMDGLAAWAVADVYKRQETLYLMMLTYKCRTKFLKKNKTVRNFMNLLLAKLVH